MNDLRIFENAEFGEIRTTVKDDEPYFCLTDVCRALEISNVGNVKARLNEKGIHSTDTLTKGGMQKLTYINESNLYKTIFQSRKESAERFTDWVTSEVLPSIRKNGGYIAGQETLSDEELLSKALLVANNKIKERDAIIQRQAEKLEEQKPKTIFADAVCASKTSILIGELAKLICQNGVQIGQKRLFQWMRDNGYLMRTGKVNMPKQKYVEQGLFEIKESTIQNPDGSARITITPKVSGAGQVYFINKFLNAEAGNE